MLVDDGLELLFDGCCGLEFAPMAGQREGQPEQGFQLQPPVVQALGQLAGLAVGGLGRVPVALPLAEAGHADQGLGTRHADRLLGRKDILEPAPAVGEVAA